MLRRGSRGAGTWGPLRTQLMQPELRFPPLGSGLQSRRGRRAYRRLTAKATLRARATLATDPPGTETPQSPRSGPHRVRAWQDTSRVPTSTPPGTRISGPRARGTHRSSGAA